MSHLVILKLFHIPSSPDWNFNLKRFLFTSWFCVYACWVHPHLHLSAHVGWRLLRGLLLHQGSQLNGYVHKLVLLQGDLGDQPLSCHKFGHQIFTEQALGILPMCAGQHTEPKSWDAVFIIVVGSVSILLSAEKHKCLSSINYIKEVKAYLNYEWSAAFAQLGRVTFNGVYI